MKVSTPIKVFGKGDRSCGSRYISGVHYFLHTGSRTRQVSGRKDGWFVCEGLVTFVFTRINHQGNDDALLNLSSGEKGSFFLYNLVALPFAFYLYIFFLFGCSENKITDFLFIFKCLIF